MDSIRCLSSIIKVFIIYFSINSKSSCFFSRLARATRTVMALYEDVVYTQRGELASNTFMQYKMPTRKDVGNIIVDFEESYEPTGPFGAKSVGEVVVNTPSPAIENAIYNGLGINLNTLPMTPGKVFMAMTNK